MGSAIAREKQLHTSAITCHPYDLASAYASASKYDWPRIRRMAVRDVSVWLDALDQMETAAARATQRAVGCLFRVAVSGYGGPENLMWALVGLEAIYTTGANGIMQQIRERIHSFLGIAERSPKLLSSMYDARSRFVHGKLDVHSDETARDVTIATDVAIALLLSSVQELISRGWFGVTFSTVCAPT